LSFCFLGEKVRFIKRHLGIMSSFNPQEERQQAREFVLHYLKDDGVFLARLLSINSSDLVVTEIINQLWIRYKTANRLYATVNPQRHIPTTQITNNEDNINTSIQGTHLNYQNGNTSHHQPRQRPFRIPPPSLPTYINQHHHFLKSEKSPKDTDV
jgi:hypothetical protein